MACCRYRKSPIEARLRYAPSAIASIKRAAPRDPRASTDRKIALAFRPYRLRPGSRHCRTEGTDGSLSVQVCDDQERKMPSLVALAKNFDAVVLVQCLYLRVGASISLHKRFYAHLDCVLPVLDHARKSISRL